MPSRYSLLPEERKEILRKYARDWNARHPYSTFSGEQKKRAYQKQLRYARRHPDRIREKSRLYRKRHPYSSLSVEQKQRRYERSRKYRQAHLEKYRQWMLQWRIKNPEKSRLMGRQNYWKHKDRVLERVKKYVAEHPEFGKLAQLRYRTREKFLVLSYYSNGKLECDCCHEKLPEFLTIDHMHGGGNRHRKELKLRKIYHWLINNDLPPGYRVLCMNCNLAFGIYGFCPHGNQQEHLEYISLFNAQLRKAWQTRPSVAETAALT